MKAKHTFKYTYEEGHEDFSPVEVTFDIPSGELTISQMLYNFECYLKACGFVFDGHLEIVEEEKYDEPSTLEDLGWEDEQYTSPTVKSPSYWDTLPTSICGSDKHNITAEDPKKFFPQHDNGLSTTSSSLEVEKNKWVHGMCNPPTKEAKKLKNEDWADSLRSQGPEFMTFKQ